MQIKRLINPASMLPDDLWLLILSRLSAKEVARTASLSKEMRKLGHLATADSFFFLPKHMLRELSHEVRPETLIPVVLTACFIECISHSGSSDISIAWSLPIFPVDIHSHKPALLLAALILIHAEQSSHMQADAIRDAMFIPSLQANVALRADTLKILVVDAGGCIGRPFAARWPSRLGLSMPWSWSLADYRPYQCTSFSIKYVPSNAFRGLTRIIAWQHDTCQVRFWLER